MRFKNVIQLESLVHVQNIIGVKDVKDLSKIIHEAFRVATTGRPGPVLIDIPKDVQFAKTKYSKPKRKKNLMGNYIINFYRVK